MQHSAIVPDNEAGASSDTWHEVTLPDEQAATAAFETVKHRLLDVNQWHELAGAASSVFRLTDEKGNLADRPAKLGDHFRIDIPAPGPSVGEGHDWVQVEAIEHRRGENEETISMRVRPAANPKGSKDDIAHFFSDEASSTFSVTRTGNRIVAEVHGRNEKPNTGTNSITDKIRNAVVGTGAMLGLNKPQWKGLVMGLVSGLPSVEE